MKQTIAILLLCTVCGAWANTSGLLANATSATAHTDTSARAKEKRPHRITGRAVILQGDRMLLLRKGQAGGKSFLYTPGGTLEAHEDATQAIVRELEEELGVIVRPLKVLMIQNILLKQTKMCGILMLCELVSGEIRPTDELRREGITEVRWFTREELANEVVSPPALKEYDWTLFLSNTWVVPCLPLDDGSR